MSLKATVTAVIALLVIYFPVAIFLSRSFDNPRPNGAYVVQLLRPFVPLGGHAYRADLLPADRALLAPFAADPTVEGSNTAITIYEGQNRIGQATNFREISNQGAGRFGFWANPGIVISTSDNTDPNTNHRNYWAVIP